MKFNQIELVSSIHQYGLDIQNRVIFFNQNGMQDDETNIINHNSSNLLIKNLYILNSISNKPITIYIDSEGGDVSSGLALYDVIKQSPSNVTMICYGNCCSAATLVLQAANTRLVMPNTNFMVHFGAVSVSDNAQPVVTYLEEYKKMLHNMLSIYTTRCINGEFFKFHKMNESKIMKFLDKKLKESSDWYLTAEECVYYGFADSVFKESNG